MAEVGGDLKSVAVSLWGHQGLAPPTQTLGLSQSSPIFAAEDTPAGRSSPWRQEKHNGDKDEQQAFIRMSSPCSHTRHHGIEEVTHKHNGSIHGRIYRNSHELSFKHQQSSLKGCVLQNSFTDTEMSRNIETRTKGKMRRECSTVPTVRGPNIYLKRELMSCWRAAFSWFPLVLVSTKTEQLVFGP